MIEPSEYEPINAGVMIHGAIYLGRPDVGCVVHTYTKADIASPGVRYKASQELALRHCSTRDRKIAIII